MTQEQIKKLISTCVSLSAERDRELLLSQILDAAMDLSNCDAGTLYLLKEDGLHFCRMVTRSMGVRQGGHDNPITLPPVPLMRTNACALAALENRLINVPDVHKSNDFDFSGPKRYDEITGYTTRSMMVVPMANEKGQLIGVSQLINCMDPESGEVIDFPRDVEELVSAISAQAAISLTNMQYSQQVNQLLDSLVNALSTAIDGQTPYNANHTRNMVVYGGRFLDWLERTNNAWRFDETQRRSFLMAIGLHDVGKLTVPLSVMNKEYRLLPLDLEKIRHRFSDMRFLARIDELEGRLTHEEAEGRLIELTEDLAFIEDVNKAGFLSDEKLDRLEQIAGKTCLGESGEIENWLTKEEFGYLSIRKGTLTSDEREIMENHVVATAAILSQVSFPKEYAQVPIWAAGHHEFINGKGYPHQKSGDEVSKEVRLLTVLDIFDALTSRDRPYKPPVPIEKALSILHSMVDEGNLDGEILELFEQSTAWEE